MNWLKVHGALLTVAFIYGTNYSIAKIAMTTIPPFAIIFCRISGAGLLFWLLHSIASKEKVASKRDYLHLALCALFGVAINQMMFFKGLSMTNPINGSVIMTTTPILVLVISSLLIKERITFTKGIGVLLGAIGAMLLIGGAKFEFASNTVAGDVLILVNAISYGIYLVIVKPLMRKYNALTITKWIFLFGFFMTLPFCWNEFSAVEWESLPLTIWGSLLFIILATTFLAYLLNAWALNFVNPSVVGVYIYLQPIIASSFAVLLGQGELTPQKMLYAGLIFVGVYLVGKSSKKKIKAETLVKN